MGGGGGGKGVRENICNSLWMLISVCLYVCHQAEGSGLSLQGCEVPVSRNSN